jgi:hypothetical protein|tara:strand:+ start:113 stop:445 length:333 start_codon:yes stop_codon:yes gene_type:complete
MKRDEILKQAETLINGDRAKDYGDAFDNFGRIAAGWNAIIQEAMKTHGEITEQHIALMMDWLKTARLLNDLNKADSWVDKCGYSALGGEFSEKDTMLEEIKKVQRKINET